MFPSLTASKKLTPPRAVYADYCVGRGVQTLHAEAVDRRAAVADFAALLEERLPIREPVFRKMAARDRRVITIPFDQQAIVSKHSFFCFLVVKL